jgi:hypothetical protein
MSLSLTVKLGAVIFHSSSNELEDPVEIASLSNTDIVLGLGLFRAPALSRRAAGTELISKNSPQKILQKPFPPRCGNGINFQKNSPQKIPKKQNRSRRAVGTELISKKIHLKKFSKNRSRGNRINFQKIHLFSNTAALQILLRHVANVGALKLLSDGISHSNVDW